MVKSSATDGIELRTDRLVIRDLRPGDARSVHEFNTRNRWYHERWEPKRAAEYYTLRFQRRLLRHLRHNAGIVQFGFSLIPATGRATLHRPPDGVITYSNIVRGPFQSCFVGYRLAVSAEGRGLMTEALSATVSYMFEVEGLHRIEANIMPTNDRSIRLITRLGFVFEGRSRRYLRIQGCWEDHDHYVLLNDRWKPRD
ncbi:MAG: GNAT family N-acetyltransferase [Spirochaetales bacterium]|nr:GNAT family N-acetyltransferase [Spirochaetales bacterium]